MNEKHDKSVDRSGNVKEDDLRVFFRAGGVLTAQYLLAFLNPGSDLEHVNLGNSVSTTEEARAAYQDRRVDKMWKKKGVKKSKLVAIAVESGIFPSVQTVRF